MIIGIILVILAVLLGAKEVVSASDSERDLRVARILNVPIIPVLISFIVIVVLRIMTIKGILA